MSAPVSPQPLRVLLVEDNAADVLLVEEALSDARRFAFELVHRETLAAAEDHLRGDETDVVLLDLGLPDAAGLESVTTLRNFDAGIPLVVFTGRDDEETALAALQAGADDYVVKGGLDPGGLARVLGYAAERRAREREAMRLRERLDEAERLETVGRLAGGVAHDFNNLLTTILGGLRLLESELPDDPEIRADLRAVTRAAETARFLTAQLLAFSGRQVWQPEPVDVGEVVCGLRTRLADLVGSGVRVTTACEAAPPAWVDPRHLEQVVYNLVMNAADAVGDAGTVALEVGSAPAREGDPTRVRLRVVDDGPGMTPEVVARAFEPFFTTKEVGEGRGLGLSIVHGILGRNGGSIELDSAPGEGTAVDVYLPAVGEDATERTVEREAERTGGDSV